MSAQGFRSFERIQGALAPPLDLDDVNDGRSLAVLSIPPQSRVFDVGSGSGAVARALAARGCHVWAIDIDSVATRLAEPWCDGILLGDVETADLDDFLGPQRADAILFLNVLADLRDPAAAIRRLVPFLAPGGKIILAVPHVAHAAVRLQLLAGAFPRTSEGLLNRTSLHFFDRSSLQELLKRAGVRVIDEARIVRSVDETEIRLNLGVFPQDAIDLATAGPDADTYEFVVTVVPSTVGPAVERVPSLVSTLTEHLHRVERNSRSIQQRMIDLESQVERHRGERDRLRAALEETHEGHRRSAEAVAAVREELRHAELGRQRSEERLTITTTQLERCQLERRFLRDDVLVKDAYLATLRQESTQCDRVRADISGLTERLDRLTAEYAAEVNRAADLAVSNRETCQQLEQARQELHRIHGSVADTLAQPRYVLADRCNAWARKAGFLHAALKRIWTGRFQGRQ